MHFRVAINSCHSDSVFGQGQDMIIKMKVLCMKSNDVPKIRVPRIQPTNLRLALGERYTKHQYVLSVKI